MLSAAVRTIHATGRRHTATVIFLHGSGDTGPNVQEWVRFLLGTDMTYSHIKIVYPTAPLQKYTPLNGEESTVWFDRRTVDIGAQECRKSLSRSYEIVQQLIKNELDEGIPLNRIIIGGFSMGGALALHAGYHVNTGLAGVFAHSSFLNRNSVVYESLTNRTKPGEPLPELRMFHGGRDSLVPPQWGQESFDTLQSLGVKGSFTVLKNTLHELKKVSLLDLQQWIHEKLPPLEGEIQNKL